MWLCRVTCHTVLGAFCELKRTWGVRYHGPHCEWKSLGQQVNTSTMIPGSVYSSTAGSPLSPKVDSTPSPSENNGTVCRVSLLRPHCAVSDLLPLPDRDPEEQWRCSKVELFYFLSHLHCNSSFNAGWDRGKRERQTEAKSPDVLPYKKRTPPPPQKKKKVLEWTEAGTTSGLGKFGFCFVFLNPYSRICFYWFL